VGGHQSRDGCRENDKNLLPLPGIEKYNRIPVGARFSAPVHTGPGAHPASCKMGTGSFPGIKRPGRGADHSPPSSAVVKKE